MGEKLFNIVTFSLVMILCVTLFVRLGEPPKIETSFKPHFVSVGANGNLTVFGPNQTSMVSEVVEDVAIDTPRAEVLFNGFFHRTRLFVKNKEALEALRLH